MGEETWTGGPKTQLKKAGDLKMEGQESAKSSSCPIR